MRRPEGWPRWLVNVGTVLNRPFGVTATYRPHQPWLSLARYTGDATYREAFAGSVYLAAATTGTQASRQGPPEG